MIRFFFPTLRGIRLENLEFHMARRLFRLLLARNRDVFHGRFRKWDTQHHVRPCLTTGYRKKQPVEVCKNGKDIIARPKLDTSEESNTSYYVRRIQPRRVKKPGVFEEYNLQGVYFPELKQQALRCILDIRNALAFEQFIYLYYQQKSCCIIAIIIST